MMREDRSMTEPTQKYCPKSGAPEGADNSTHHLRPKGGRMVCAYCGKTERELREAGDE